jgi:hypothetical protein
MHNMERQQKEKHGRILGILGEYRGRGGISKIKMDCYKLECHMQYTSEASTSISTSKEHSLR